MDRRLIAICMVFSLAMWALLFGSILLAFSSTPFQILIIYMLGGIGIAFFAPSISSYVGNISGKAMSGFNSFMYIGFAVSSLMV